MAKKKIITIPSYSHEPTSDKNLFRVVDRKGDWTHYFLKKQKRYIPAVNHVIHCGFPKGERFLTYLLNSSKEESQRKLKAAGEEGTRTHQAIRDLIDGARIHTASKYYNEITGRNEVLNNEEWDNLQAFVGWWEKYQPTVLMHEFSIAHDKIGFAGTPDFVGTILIPEGDKNAPKEVWGKRILVLLDWKTSSGIWDEYKLQTAAYKEALTYNGIKKDISKYKHFFTGVIRVGTNHKCGYEMELWNEVETLKHYNQFCAAYETYQFITKEDADFSPYIEQIPSEFKLKLKNNKIPCKKY